MPLSGMLAEVTQLKVRGLLAERDPAILDENDAEQVARFEARVEGASVEVILVVGTDPASSRIRAVAVEAIAIQTASEIEYATFPEQQAAGDIGRGFHLHQRYRELLLELRRIVAEFGGVPDDGVIVAGGYGLPKGRFPAAEGYPDPIQIRGRS